MGQPQPVLHDGFAAVLVQRSTGIGNSGLGADQGNYQVQLRAAVDGKSDAAKHAVDFSKRSKSIDVNRLHSGCLEKQLFVVHGKCPPPRVKETSYARLGKTRKLKTAARACDKSCSEVESNFLRSFGGTQ